jgi:hypothetical protein
MSGADNGATDPASESEDVQNVPTQRRGSCACGHPDAEHHHPPGERGDGVCRRSRLHGGLGLSELLVVALRRGR